MGRLYYQTELEVQGEFSSALAIGDSWFWYPNKNILETLIKHKKISSDHANVRVLGANGAALQQYVGAGEFAQDVAHWLTSPFNRGFSEFYISGAGNDAVDYRLALRPNCSTFTKPAACIDPQGMDELLKLISEALGALIHNIRWAYRDDPLTRPVFVNGYDYPVPDGRGFDIGILKSGPWLTPAMNACQVIGDPDLRFGITKILIDRLNDEVLAPFDQPGNEVVHIDSRGTLSHDLAGYRADWKNELHPTSAGFKKIFEKHWLPALRKYGIAR